MSKVLVITTSLRARSKSDIRAGSLLCGGISDMGEASGRNEESDEAYVCGKTLA